MAVSRKKRTFAPENNTRTIMESYNKVRKKILQDLRELAGKYGTRLKDGSYVLTADEPVHGQYGDNVNAWFVSLVAYSMCCTCFILHDDERSELMQDYFTIPELGDLYEKFKAKAEAGKIRRLEEPYETLEKSNGFIKVDGTPSQGTGNNIFTFTDMPLYYGKCTGDEFPKKVKNLDDLQGTEGSFYIMSEDYPRLVHLVDLWNEENR